MKPTVQNLISMTWSRIQWCVLIATLTLLPMASRSFAQDQPATEETTAAKVSTETGVAGETAVPVSSESALPGLMLLLMVIAVFVIPIIIGGYLAKKWKMPEHGWRFSLAIGSIAAAALVLYFGELKFGPDLSGGITLIYELQDTSSTATAGNQEVVDEATGQTISSKRALIQKMVGALSERVDPSGTKEVSIREYGPEQIEIIIPKASQEELSHIEKKIYTAGALEFRITASPAFSENREIIELAQALPPNQNEVIMGGKKVAEWMAYKQEEFGAPDEPNPRVVKRMAGNQPQALVLMNDGYDVTGDYLSQSASGVDEIGNPIVRFQFNDQGAARFGQLTGTHLPNPSGQHYALGIILDKELRSAPNINSKITNQGEISGINSKAEVDFLVEVLDAGSLPLSLNKEPISRETISPTLGAETVERGKTAMALCLLISVVFMSLYYRLAGVVASVALCVNLLLTLGVMVLFHAAFTLPGLAGLVLGVGMSVDANVLIFERIREERARGAALRMAIRNGYDRAFTTILDSNMCNLITAVVIYRIAPDNVKGFGVTLIISIVMSMFASVFLTRIIFDVAERVGKIKDLKMTQAIGKTNFDFMGKRFVAIGASWVLIAVGMFAVFQRGADLLNIDFTGGSSVTMVLKDEDNMTFSEVLDVLNETALADKNLSIVEVGEGGTRFTVSSIEQDVVAVQKIIQDKFGDKLQTYQVETTNLEPIGEQTGAVGRRKISARLVNFQADAEDTEAVEETAEAPAGDDATSPAEETSETEAAPAAEATVAAPTTGANLFEGGTSARLTFGEEGDDDAGVNFETIEHMLSESLAATGHQSARMEINNPEYLLGSARRFNFWDVKLALPQAEAEKVFNHLETTTNSQPVFPLANKIGGRVADDLRTKAIAAIVVSFIGIIAYVWFRFHGWIYGVAAVIAIVHDVLITVGFLAMSAWLVQSIPGLASALMIEKFQISLPVVASLLTIIGYSLNDTIVVFDRIREVKGKSPKLTGEMINQSVNETLSRTLLTSSTTILSVIVLYIMGGEGIHGFTFALVIGIVVGTYSSVFIASPILLWLSHADQGSPASALSQSSVGSRDLAATK
jgi:SecD/SecF fusion protein